MNTPATSKPISAAPCGTMFIQIGRRRWEIESFAEASRVFGEARNAHAFGASKTPTPMIVDEAGRPVAHISYNGRVWAGAEWKAGATPLFDPSFPASLAE